MIWDYQRAFQRVQKSLSTTPAIRVETFNEYLPRIRALKAALNESMPQSDIIRDLRPDEAVVVDTVQLYVNVINYNEMRLEAGRETEASHGRALSFLHVHYAALDRATDGVQAQRVDFHGPRMHAAFIVPSGSAADLREAVGRAVKLANDTIALSRAGSRDIVRSQITPKFRIGIDVGRCVAVDSGSATEREPLFIGSAANYAAKLAEGDVGGIFASDRVRALFAISKVGDLSLERSTPISAAALSVSEIDAATETRKLEEMREDIRSHRDSTIGADGFVFHYHSPPLKTIDYQILKPSNTIRMQLVSIFADLDRYTAYIDRAMANGKIGEAVRDLHVIRAELNAVLQDDFSGRKVRFIGDCLHGLIAAGSATETDLVKTVTQATACVGAMRSSFGICLDALPTASSLGLAIGYELGPTPISRVGIRGDRSVRVASSLATLNSERCQAECSGTQTKIGERAREQAPLAIRSLFGNGGVGTNIDFDTVAMQTGSASSSLSVPEPVEQSRHHLKS